jgi:hypothetical protein
MEDEIEILEGTITGFGGSWGSGLGVLFIDGLPVHCENASTVRALDACFGDVIDNNHSVNQDAIIGKRISYSVDFVGVLEGFSPLEETQ